jgi:hypothetical protein
VGKFIAGLFRFFITLLVLGAIVFLFFEVRRLDGEVAELKRRSSVIVKNGKRTETSSPVPSSKATDPAGHLTAARGHVEQAEALLRRKDYSAAMRELSAATKAVGDAGEEAQTRSRKSFAELTKAIAALKEKAESLGVADNERSNGGRQGENR